jgi:basic amino acid/polyamine antiporter, APA family
MTSTARALGLWSATALVVGNMIGSGVFLLPAALAPFGAASLMGWGLSTVGALLLAVAFAGLGRRYPVCGGPYTYSRIAFGDFIGFMMAWCYWISTWCAVAAIAVAFTGSVTSLVPGLLGTPARSAACSLGVLWLCTACNLAGVRSAGIAQLITTVLKLLPLIAIVVLGASAMNFDSFHPFNPSPNSLLDVTTMSAALALWALLGFESATIPAEHVDDAERTIPRATMIGIVIAAIVTVGACTVVLGLVPLDQLKDSPAPFADAARSLWGAGGSIVMAAAMAVSCLGALNGWILIQGQIPFAAARDGLFPKPFARVDERGTPRTGLVIGSVLASLLVFTNYNGSLVSVFTSAALLATAACLLPYLFTAAAFWKLDATFAERKAWRKPVAVLGLIYSVWALIGTGSEVLLWGGGLLVAGVPVFFMIKRGATPEMAASQSPP